MQRGFKKRAPVSAGTGEIEGNGGYIKARRRGGLYEKEERLSKRGKPI